MTGWRFAVLFLIATCLAGVGAFLFFEPAPAQPISEIPVSDALLASSASAGVGLWLPQLAVVEPIINSGNNSGPALVALAPTRTPAPTNPPQATETALPVSSTPTSAPSLTSSPSSS